MEFTTGPPFFQSETTEKWVEVPPYQKKNAKIFYSLLKEKKNLKKNFPTPFPAQFLSLLKKTAQFNFKNWGKKKMFFFGTPPPIKRTKKKGKKFCGGGGGPNTAKNFQRGPPKKTGVLKIKSSPL